MFIQRCKDCSKQFQWKTVIKSIWGGYKPIECDNCKTKYQPNLINRLILSSSIALPVLFSRYLYRIFKTYPSIILAYLTWIVIMVAISPFYFKYHIKD